MGWNEANSWQFIAQAEEKLNECITTPFDPEPRIEDICGHGADPAFDQLIVALGHIASPKPKALIDSMMLWRKTKSDAANEARAQLQQARPNYPAGPLLRRNTEPVGPPGVGGAPETGPPTNPNFAAKQEHVLHSERRSTVSIYILCRVLLEVTTQSTLQRITPEMENRLEGIIFGQLKIADGEQLANSPLKLANWKLFAKLLGKMSDINFIGVTRRFIEDLEGSLQEKFIKTPTAVTGRDVEGKLELVLDGMSHLRIKIVPEEAWERSCNFLISLGKLFNKSHGQRVKTAFCRMIENMLLPIAAQASNSHLMHPKWAEVLSAIGQRLGQMLVKPRHWAAAFPLTATMLCVSSPETFSSQWLQLILPLQTKIKDRSAKPLCLQVVSRLLWAYLYRANDTQQNTIRKLDEILKLVLPAGKRSVVASDTAVTEPLIQIIRIVGFRFPEYCFRQIIFPLINADSFASTKDLKVEQLDPDRIVVGIRAFLCIMSDLEKGEQGQPPFPQLYHASTSTTDRASASPASTPTRSGLDCATSTSSTNDAHISRPVLTHVLSDGVRDYYLKFCEILGKITIICDNTFGGQAALDEKFGSPGPKTPITDTFNFSRRDEQPPGWDQKQAFYELLRVAVQALPRCLSVDIPFNSIINLLCTGTAHLQYNVADTSACSLKAIARQARAQQVIHGFARFIFNFDDRYATMSDGGMLGPGHIENTLRLYVELLQIWIEEIRQKIRNAAGDSNSGGIDKRAALLDLSSIWAEVDQAEAHGLFFLCSQSRRVRHFAITVLRLITEIDKALGKESEGQESTRLIDILENDAEKVVNFSDEHLTVAERSRLQRGLKKSGAAAVVELCTSDVPYDSSLWFKIFPNFILLACEKCPFTVAIGRDLICDRTLQMYKDIVFLSEPQRGPLQGTDPGSARSMPRPQASHPETTIEQWKLYLIFACTTLADPGASQSAVPKDPAHSRKSSRTGPVDKGVTARTLFKYLIPLLSASSVLVRDAVVVAMGSSNIHIYRALLEELQGQVSRCNDEARARIHQRTNSSPRRNRTIDLLRTEITHVFKLTSHFLKEREIYEQEFFLGTLTAYTKDLKLFLMDGEVQMDWDFQKLRRYYCGLMEALFDGINRTSDPSRWMTFESRKSAFSLMEDWCGFSPNGVQIRAREDTMRKSVIDQQAMAERQTVTAAMEIEKRNLRTAALSAMAALCGGPISVTTESGVVLQFDVRRMLAWLESIFGSESERMNLIGRRALENLVVHNKEYPYLLDHCIARCYLARDPMALQSHFAVITQVLQNHSDYRTPFWKLLALCLFTLGNDSSDIRSKSAVVLRILEARQKKKSRIQDFDISISDKTQAVYKLAQFEMAKRLAGTYHEHAFFVFSELTSYFKDVGAPAQRNIVAVVLPWIQTIELRMDADGNPTGPSYMLLANLLEITIKSSGALHNEVQALWQALATGPHLGNVRLVMDFIIRLCLERREQNFVEYAKQVVVFLSTTTSTPSIKVVEFLLMQLTVKGMVPIDKEALPPPPDIREFQYCADLTEAVPVGAKQAAFSLGQLAVILLVDLMVSPVQLAQDSLPVLLNTVLVLWDHYTPLVQGQAREMLVHIIHEFVFSRMDDRLQPDEKKTIEDLIELIRQHDRKVVWGYEDHNGKMDDFDNKVPSSMEYLTTEVLKTFESCFPGIQEQWARVSLTWATSCSVRHLASRSLQIFRCIFTTVDQFMLQEIISRLTNTISEDDLEIQSFNIEVLATMEALISRLDADRVLNFPQLFWATFACLGSTNEREFLTAVDVLNLLISKVDLQSPAVRKVVLDGQPRRWDGPFEGIQPLLYKGLRSSLCWQKARETMNNLVVLPSDPLIGDDHRLFYALLANFPSLLNELETGSPSEVTIKTALMLKDEADKEGLESVVEVLDEYCQGNCRDNRDFIVQLFSAIQEYYLPKLDFKMITFLIGLLTNSLSWVKVQTMRILCVAIPEVDMRNPELAGHGSDLISPLLRLLQTEYCMEALEVLDNIMALPGSHMDKHHLRMSMTRSTSKAIRQEYGRTQSLFGIPEATGWAIPIPARQYESARTNIAAVIQMFSPQNTGGSVPEPPSTASVAFEGDDFQYEYFHQHTRTNTMTMEGEQGEEEPALELAMKLDDLDDFFDDESDTLTDDDGSSRTITEYTPETFESGAQLYDEQILPILHQASNSNASYQSGFGFERPPPRETGSNTMNPGAFSVVVSSRPALHSRSITSPSAPASYQAQMGEITSDSEGLSDMEEEQASQVASQADSHSPSNNPEHMQPPRPAPRRFANRSRDERHPGRAPSVPATSRVPLPTPNKARSPNMSHHGDRI